MTAKKKASGRNIPEAERGTIQVKLRLPPDVADDLDELARRWNLTRSGAVARLVESAPDVQSNERSPP
jgi:predicted transcriptional regulator